MAKLSLHLVVSALMSPHAVSSLAAPSVPSSSASSSRRAPAGDNPTARTFANACWAIIDGGERSCSLGEDVEIRETKAKGRGVFAKRNIPAGTLLCRYTGDVRSRADHDRICDSGDVSDYACDLGEDWVIDASGSPHSGWAHILNHSRRNNVDFWLSSLPYWLESRSVPQWQLDLLASAPLPTDPYALWYETTRDVAAGEEFCTGTRGERPLLETMAAARA